MIACLIITIIYPTALGLHCQLGPHHIYGVSEDSSKHASKGSSSHSPKSIAWRGGVIQWELLER